MLKSLNLFRRSLVSGIALWSWLGNESIANAQGPLAQTGIAKTMIGWLLVLIGLLFSVAVASNSLAEWTIRRTSLPTGVGEWLMVPGNVWVVALGLIGTQLPLRLPDGRLPSPRWIWFSRVTLALIAVACVGMAVQPGRVNDLAGTSNPLGSEALKPFALSVIAAGHCTGWRAQTALAEAFGEAVLAPTAAGKSYTFAS